MSSNNPSVRRFKTDMQNLVNKAKYDFHQETLAMADEVIGNMHRAIPHNVSGHLSQSLRKKDVTNSDQSKISVLVIGGGRLTTRRTAKGNSYDYALAEEFGTVKETPRPFFYSTYRFYIQRGQEQFRETFDQTIEENNKVRANRANNYSNSAGVRSASYRGAVAIHK
jgi:hypothetical protein